jgi:putative spermidine/putrescine transport system ATP-binding protein
MNSADQNNDTLVRFSNVQKTYDGNTLVVRDLNLDVRKGEFLSLLGPSGSGKTTTLMMLAGFESPTEGDIYLSGQPITKKPPHKRNFGMVFQNYALFPHMTVGQNVAYPLSVRKLSSSEQQDKARKALDMVKLTSVIDRYPHQLSGGQQQRVALARALVFDPQLVLMDEPLGALDKQLREHMQLELKSIHRQLGLTFVYVTHDQSEALTMSDRVAVFNDGIIQQIGPVGQLYEEPANPFVASFIGDSNTLKAQLMASGAKGSTVQAQLSDGSILEGLWVNPQSPSATGSVTCHIRPERVQMVDAGQVGSFAARVKDVIYFGDHLRLRCMACDAQEITVKLPIGQTQVPLSGQTVNLSVLPAHLRIYS